MVKRERDEAADARILHMQRTLETVARTSEVYAEMSIRWEPPRDMDREYVQGLANKEAAKGPDDPSKVNWNWFCGRDKHTLLGWKCAIKHIKGRKEIGDIRRDGADSPHTWSKVVLLLSLANVETRDVGLAVNCIRDNILPDEFRKIKESHAAKSRKGVARRSGVFGTKKRNLSKDGFMVKKNFVKKKDLAILEAMNLEFLPTDQSG